MEVQVSLTHKCELLAVGMEDPSEYVRIGNQLKTFLDPYVAETFDSKELYSQIKEILAPCTDYQGELVFIEFVVGEDVDSSKTMVITENEFNKYKYQLPHDGLYVYYKVAISKKEFLGEEYATKIYYDNGKIMFNNSEIKDPSELIDYLTQTGKGILDYCEESVFSLCRLEHCSFELERKVLEAGLGTCGIVCEKSINLKNQRNFLFISLYVLKHLISEEKYDEAENILKRLNTCSFLCKNMNPKFKNCNCY